LWAEKRRLIHIERLRERGIEWALLPANKYTSVDVQQFHLTLEDSLDVIQIQRITRLYSLKHI